MTLVARADDYLSGRVSVVLGGVRFGFSLEIGGGVGGSRLGCFGLAFFSG